MEPIARVLIVDDEAAQATALSLTLEEQGYETLALTSAAEGLSMLRSSFEHSTRAFDLLITDLNLPGMNGIEVLRAALRIDELLAVVVVTGFGSIDAAVEAMRNGASDFIEKPFRLSTINSVLTRALAARRLRRENAALQKRVEERTRELETANGELRAVNIELDAFAHAVSHDLRNPLSGIIGFAALLSSEIHESLSSDQKRYLQEIQGCGERLLHLTRHLLDVAQLGYGAVAKQRVAMAELVGGITTELLQQHPNRAIEFRIGSLPDPSGEATLLRQVFANLLANAVKFTADAAPARIEVTGECDGGHCIYSVRDNGVGFDKALADTLFAPFSRLHSAAHFAGTGVGLSVVKRIVERHGGKVTAEGELGRGACIRVYLPC